MEENTINYGYMYGYLYSRVRRAQCKTTYKDGWATDKALCAILQ